MLKAKFISELAPFLKAEGLPIVSEHFFGGILQGQMSLLGNLLLH